MTKRKTNEEFIKDVADKVIDHIDRIKRLQQTL